MDVLQECEGYIYAYELRGELVFIQSCKEELMLIPIRQSGRLANEHDRLL